MGNYVSEPQRESHGESGESGESGEYEESGESGSETEELGQPLDVLDSIARGVEYRPNYICTNVYNAEEVMRIVQHARATKTQVRCMGSGHSYRKSIVPDKYADRCSGAKLLKLDGDLRTSFNAREVTGDDGRTYLEVRVGAGMHIGRYPKNSEDPENLGFAERVDKLGYALPITGGIILQTIAGFMSTSSAGGSLQHGFSDVVDRIEFVNGKGELKIADKGSDLWNAVGVSMGLFGVITHVTFLLQETFYVKGVCENVEFDDSKVGPGKLEQALRNNEYFRAMWFPQKYVHRVKQFVGARAPTPDTVKPYQDPLSQPVWAVAASAIAARISWLLKHGTSDKNLKNVARLLKRVIIRVPPQWPITQYDEYQEFYDKWYRVLPMDNMTLYNIFRVEFSELWFPVQHCQLVMDKLHDLFKRKPRAAGNFSIELYSAKASPFWLSMSQGGDRLRMDAIWIDWSGTGKDQLAYYTDFWETLMGAGMDCRLHWGKRMPSAGKRVSKTVTYDLGYLKSVYPMLDKWLELRRENDPDNIFLSEYWAKYFEIDSDWDMC